jgi:hypothetical protein
MKFPFLPTKNSEESNLAAPQEQIRFSTEQRNGASNESDAAPFAAALRQKPPIKRIAKETDAINTEAFVDSVISDLGDHVMGYCMLLQGRKGNVIGEVNHGYARSLFEDGGAQSFK